MYTNCCFCPFQAICGEVLSGHTFVPQSTSIDEVLVILKQMNTFNVLAYINPIQKMLFVVCNVRPTVVECLSKIN